MKSDFCYNCMAWYMVFDGYAICQRCGIDYSKNVIYIDREKEDKK